jgi:hypothetical protein
MEAGGQVGGDWMAGTGNGEVEDGDGWWTMDVEMDTMLERQKAAVHVAFAVCRKIPPTLAVPMQPLGRPGQGLCGQGQMQQAAQGFGGLSAPADRRGPGQQRQDWKPTMWPHLLLLRLQSS